LNERLGPARVFVFFGSQSSSASAEDSRNKNSTSAVKILLDNSKWRGTIIN
jgi:hypothetical protein